jgi:hypothetical protein
MPQPYRAPLIGHEGGPALLLYAPAPPRVFFIGTLALLSSPLSSTRPFVLSRQDSVRTLPTCQAVLATGGYGLHSAELAHLPRRVDACRGGA